MEWTAREIVSAAFLESDVIGYDPNYVALISYIIGKASRQTHCETHRDLSTSNEANLIAAEQFLTVNKIQRKELR